MPIIGSPPCTYFSMLQELNKLNQRHSEKCLARLNDNLVKAIDHIKFCIKLYKMQMDAGRYWLHEHPWSAKSWQIPEMEELLGIPECRSHTQTSANVAEQQRSEQEATREYRQRSPRDSSAIHGRSPAG